MGFVSGLIGIGGAIIMIPAMTVALKFRVHLAVGTAAGFMIFTSLAGALGYVLNGMNVAGLPDYSVGYLNLPAWACLAGASVGVAQLGAGVAHRVSERILKIVFVTVMFYLGLRMIGVFDWLGWPL